MAEDRRAGLPPRTFSNAGRGLPHVFADGGYVGPKLGGAMQKAGTFTLKIVTRTDKAKGFEVLPSGWVVERVSHGWGDAAGWPGTGRNPSLPQKPGYKSLAFACSPAGSQELDGSCPRFREAKPSNSNNHIN
ncbi:hypothetical protein GCM10007880_64960 [Mesorhizobium amorphae]|nr:hypothetical protein GCM10007880_64960 [Mesorhizobium amorphae]